MRLVIVWVGDPCNPLAVHLGKPQPLNRDPLGRPAHPSGIYRDDIPGRHEQQQGLVEQLSRTDDGAARSYGLKTCGPQSRPPRRLCPAPPRTTQMA